MENKYVKSILMPIIVIIAIILLSAGGTYAFFVARVEGTETSSTVDVTGTDIALSFVDGGTNTFDIVNNIVPGWHKSRNFSILGINTSDRDLYYDLEIVIEKNEFSADGVLTYSLVTDSVSTGAVSNSGNIMKEPGTYSLFNSNNLPKFGNTTEEGISHSYVLTISFPNDPYNVQNEQNKKFKAYLQLISGKISGRNSINGTF